MKRVLFLELLVDYLEIKKYAVGYFFWFSC